MMQFMQGRYGADQMGQMLSAVSMVFLIISLFSRNQAWFLLAVIGIVYNYFRMFSKNISKRYAENQKYLKMTAGIRRKLASWKSQLAQRKIYHIYRCPGCKQKIRVPRGRGKIEIRCPKCNTRFVKKIMFGYIIVNKQELKFREFDVYQSYYCGLCQSLKERFGRRGQLTLSYDMTFVALLLSALYDEPVESSTCKCVAHPFEAHATSRSVFTDYAADMNLLLSYYKCLDDWTDERKWKGRLRAAALRGRDKMVEARYPEKAEHIYTLLEHIHLYEKAQEPDVDLASGCFGEIMGEILACRKDEWEDDLRRMGFFLGKFIYLMDAYEDMEKDEKDGNYNVFLLRRKKLSDDEAFEQEAYQILQMMMAECSRIFEKLPILEHAEILRNILYSGVWCRYEMIQKKRKQKDA